MDPNIIAAVISVSGSATIAIAGGLTTWYRSKRKKLEGRATLRELREHPVLSLEQDGAMLVTCK